MHSFRFPIVPHLPPPSYNQFIQPLSLAIKKRQGVENTVWSVIRICQHAILLSSSRSWPKSKSSRPHRSEKRTQYKSPGCKTWSGAISSLPGVSRDFHGEIIRLYITAHSWAILGVLLRGRHLIWPLLDRWASGRGLRVRGQIGYCSGWLETRGVLTLPLQGPPPQTLEWSQHKRTRIRFLFSCNLRKANWMKTLGNWLLRSVDSQCQNATGGRKGFKHNRVADYQTFSVYNSQGLVYERDEGGFPVCVYNTRLSVRVTLSPPLIALSVYKNHHHPYWSRLCVPEEHVEHAPPSPYSSSSAPRSHVIQCH